MSWAHEGFYSFNGPVATRVESKMRLDINWIKYHIAKMSQLTFTLEA